MKKRKNILALLCFILATSFAVSAQDYSAIDTKVRSYKRFSSPEALVKKINSDFKTPEQKVRAAFIWISNNFWYDMEEYRNPKQRMISFRYSSEAERLQKLQEQIDKLVNTAFRSKKGVCEEYAQALKKVCDLLGIEAEVIKGYVRNSPVELDRMPNRTNHAWNAVKLHEKWMFIDATWAAGYAINGDWKKEFNDYYFNIPTERLSLSHFPSEKKWRKGLGVSSLLEYYEQPIYHNPFLTTDLEIISPKEGIITTNSSQSIKIKLSGHFINNVVRYSFYGQRYSFKPKMKKVGNTTTLTISNPGATTYLYLVINNVNAVSYKVVVN